MSWTVFEGKSFTVFYDEHVVDGEKVKKTELQTDQGSGILNADLRKQYKKCKNVKEAIAVYKKNKKLTNTNKDSTL